MGDGEDMVTQRDFKDIEMWYLGIARESCHQQLVWSLMHYLDHTCRILRSIELCRVDYVRLITQVTTQVIRLKAIWVLEDRQSGLI